MALVGGRPAERNETNAMNTTELLQELHRLHLKIRDLRNEAEQGPRRLQKFRAKVEHHQKALHDAQELIKHLKVTMNEKEVSIKANLDAIARHQQQMNTASDRRTYDALRREIDNEKAANHKLEDEILEIMGQIEDRSRQLPELEKSLRQAQEEYQRASSDIVGRQKDLESQRNEALAALKQLEAQIPEEIRGTYVRLVNAKSAGAISAVVGRSCEGCNTEVTMQQYNDLLTNRLALCKSCGCLLYLPR